MATILEFRAREPQEVIDHTLEMDDCDCGEESSIETKGAELIIFPGVRYERADPTEGDVEPDYDDDETYTASRSQYVERDRLILED